MENQQDLSHTSATLSDSGSDRSDTYEHNARTATLWLRTPRFVGEVTTAQGAAIMVVLTSMVNHLAAIEPISSWRGVLLFVALFFRLMVAMCTINVDEDYDITWSPECYLRTRRALRHYMGNGADVPNLMLDGYAAALAMRWNQRMHSTNGNIATWAVALLVTLLLVKIGVFTAYGWWAIYYWMASLVVRVTLWATVQLLGIDIGIDENGGITVLADLASDAERDLQASRLAATVWTNSLNQVLRTATKDALVRVIMAHVLGYLAFYGVAIIGGLYTSYMVGQIYLGVQSTGQVIRSASGVLVRGPSSFLGISLPGDGTLEAIAGMLIYMVVGISAILLVAIIQLFEYLYWVGKFIVRAVLRVSESSYIKRA